MPGRHKDSRGQLDLAEQFRELRRAVRLGRTNIQIEPGQELRDAIAAHLHCGLTGRTLESLAKLLDLPEAIQRAIPHRVNKRLAFEILKLPPQTQDEIASSILAGISRAELVRKYGFVGTGRLRNAPAAFAVVLKLLSTMASSALVDADELARVDVQGLDVQSVLDESVELLERVLARRREMSEKSPASRMS
jgi:hypothetical protein